MFIERTDSREHGSPYNQQQPAKHPKDGAKDGKDQQPTRDRVPDGATDDAIDISLVSHSAEQHEPDAPLVRAESEAASVPTLTHIDIKA